MKTTLNKIKAHNPCDPGWEKLLNHLGKTEADDEDLPLLTILESNGLDDALWALRAVEGKDREIRLMACDFADQVRHLMKDERSTNAIDVSRRFANGDATSEDLKAARDAARDAARGAAWDAARDAAWGAALDAVWAASNAASAAALDAVWAASNAVWAASAAVWAASKEKQVEIFKTYMQ